MGPCHDHSDGGMDQEGKVVFSILCSRESTSEHHSFVNIMVGKKISHHRVREMDQRSAQDRPVCRVDLIFLGFFCHEAITHITNCKEMSWVGRIQLKILPQSPNELIGGPCREITR